MLIEPPIDKLIEIAGCKYALVCVTAKRVRELFDKRRNEIEYVGINPVSYAAFEIFEGEVGIGED